MRACRSSRRAGSRRRPAASGWGRSAGSGAATPARPSGAPAGGTTRAGSRATSSVQRARAGGRAGRLRPSGAVSWRRGDFGRLRRPCGAAPSGGVAQRRQLLLAGARQGGGPRRQRLGGVGSDGRSGGSGAGDRLRRRLARRRRRLGRRIRLGGARRHRRPAGARAGSARPARWVPTAATSDQVHDLYLLGRQPPHIDHGDHDPPKNTTCATAEKPMAATGRRRRAQRRTRSSRPGSGSGPMG